jgi:hypothetical protein
MDAFERQALDRWILREPPEDGPVYCRAHRGTELDGEGECPACLDAQLDAEGDAFMAACAAATLATRITRDAGLALALQLGRQLRALRTDAVLRVSAHEFFTRAA